MTLTRTRAITFIGVLVTLGLFVCVFVWPKPWRYRQRPFSPKVWNGEFASPDYAKKLSVRQTMLKDLLNNVLPGKSREEVEALLGENEDWSTNSDWDCLYELGLSRNIVWETLPLPFEYDNEEVLVLWFDESNRFHQWSVPGRSGWPGIVGAPASRSFRNVQ